MSNLEGLIEDVYVAALRPERWPATLRAIAAAAGSRDCVFQTLRISPSGAKVVSSLGGEIDSDTMAGYASLIARLGDPRVEYSIRQPVGRVYQDHHAMTAAEMRRHPYYQEFMLPLGFKFVAIVFGVMERTGGCSRSTQARSHGCGKGDCEWGATAGPSLQTRC